MSDTQPTRTELVADLAKPGEAILLTLDPHKIHMLHMAVGLADEVFELIGATDRPNVLEELGDAGFYLEGILIAMPFGRPDLDIGEVLPLSIQATLLALAAATGEVLGDIKRYAIQNKELNLIKLTKDLVDVNAHLNSISEAYGFTNEEIHTNNYRKLKGGPKARYADGYSDAAAHARADKA